MFFWTEFCWIEFLVMRYLLFAQKTKWQKWLVYLKNETRLNTVNDAMNKTETPDNQLNAGKNGKNMHE